MTTTTKPLKIYAPAGAAPYPEAIAQIEDVMRDERAVAGVLCADHHVGYSLPIGGVVAYENAISPSGVGVDIACGNKAVRTNITVAELSDDLPRVMDEITEKISFGMGRNRVAGGPEPNDSLFEHHADTLRGLDRLAGKRNQLTQRAYSQLGTVGGGNHYVDLLADESGYVWAACHFGSRGLGHKIATGFAKLAAGRRFDDRGPEPKDAVVFDIGSELGDSYLEAMWLAGDYAYAGRDYVIAQVLEILGANAQLEVHNHHNYAWHEHGLWIVRKGATPLTEELSFIGGSMREGAAVVRRRPDVVREDLGSAPHGAGRVMSRRAAAGKQKRTTRYSCTDRDCDYWVTPQRHDEMARALEDPAPLVCPHHKLVLRRHTHYEQVSGGVIDWPAVQNELAAEGIELRGGGADEAPGVYKSLADVLAAHENVEVVKWLRPLGVVMAPRDVRPDD